MKARILNTLTHIAFTIALFNISSVFAALPSTVSVTPQYPDNIGVINISGPKIQTVAAGTAYTLTNTAAAVDFGTTDPAITISRKGRFLLIAKIQLDYVGATYAAIRDVTLTIRRTNNTPADVESVVQGTGVITTTTGTHGTFYIVAQYETENATDALTIYASVSTVASAGSETVSAASITAIPQ